MSWRQQGWRYLFSFLLILGVSLGGVGCSDRPPEPQQLLSEPTEQPNRLTGGISEVSPPQTVQALGQLLEIYQPQVKIVSPRRDQVFQDQSVTVRLQVRDLPLFKDADLGLGPHLNLFVDDQPYQAVYDTREPVLLSNLAPGSHTLRVFAARPWHESFKNEGAFDQVTFHIYAQTPTYRPDRDRPLLTYSRPQGQYGAEPIMLDFYLTNAPLHLIAQADADDDIADWRIRCQVNGQSFIFDQWQPIYLKGFKPGKNWLQLELIDEQGQAIANAFNNTVRVIDYQPGGTDTLSQLVRDELTVAAVKGIVDPTYEPPAPAPAEPAAAPTPSEPEPEPEALPEPAEPEVIQPQPEPAQPEVLAPAVESEPTAPERVPDSADREEAVSSPPVTSPPPEAPAISEPENLEAPADFRLQPVPTEPPASALPQLLPDDSTAAEAVPETLTEPSAPTEVSLPAEPTANAHSDEPANTPPQPAPTSEPMPTPPEVDPATDTLPKSSIEPALPDPAEMPVEIIEDFPPAPTEPAPAAEAPSAGDSRQFFNRFRRLQQRLIEAKPALSTPSDRPNEPTASPSDLEPPLDAASSPQPTEQPVGLPTDTP
ncbi:hypothetical protein [Almyronema epifaneia]|uniref:FHA domain containing protein n=1 Tax=Almyronema epifaneia S1 TaxID=2991925 RepID=A0ABW6IK58_9CYAN